MPTECSHREVLVRGYVHEVVIACASEKIAHHGRPYEREDFVFNPLHCLGLLERKIGALDQAAPLVGWNYLRSSQPCAGCSKRACTRPARVRPSLATGLEDVLAGVRKAIATRGN